MRILLLSIVLLGVASGPPSDYPIAAVPMTDVRIEDDFWRPRMNVNRTVTIPHIMRQNETTGRIANFLKAARKLDGPYKGQRYNDTDVYKTIEAASYSLALVPDPNLDRELDAIIAAIAGAQEADGYIFPARTIDPKSPPPGTGPERWSYLHTSHELYNAGHLYEAAVAHYKATGKRTLLDVALKNADLVCSTFGPGKRLEAPGHEEIELALVKLYRVTGNRKYLDESKFFLEQGVADDRGKAAIQRGPLVYAIEAVDNGGRALDVLLPLETPLRGEFRKDLLKGVEVITAQTGSPARLVTAVPYFAWANRGNGETAVWIPYR